MPVRHDDILEELKKSEATLRASVGKKGGASEDDVWSVYASMERLAAVLKLRMGTDVQGTLKDVPKSKTPERFLQTALASAGGAIDELEKDNLTGALESIRSSRTDLRAYLAELNRARMREKRKARSASRPSSA